MSQVEADVSNDDRIGRYGFPGVPGLEVGGDQAGLRVWFPGAPDWLDSHLERTDERTFAAKGGALSGSRVRFRRDARGRVTHLDLVGRISLPRHPAADPPSYQFVPTPEPDHERDAAFDALYARGVERGSGGVIPYDLPYPKHLFLDALCRRRGLLLHGSANWEIERFEPRGETLGPTRERSGLAVSACADGIWPITYAIIDRSRARGAFHNIALEFRSEDRAGRIYHFSIHQGHFESEPPVFVAGMVYILPSASFRLVTDGPLGRNSLEFASDAPVAPLARLPVSWSDLPVPLCGHDDSGVLAALDFVDRMYAECEEGLPLEDGFELRFTARADLERDLIRLQRTFRSFYPWASGEIEGATFRLTGSPGLRSRIARGLDRVRRRSRQPTH